MRSPNHDDRQDGPASPIPKIPPIRSYIVTRQTETGSYIDQRTFDAHEFEVFAGGASFRTYAIHPLHGATFTLRTILRPNTGWLEIEESLPTVSLILPEPSQRLLS